MTDTVMLPQEPPAPMSPAREVAEILMRSSARPTRTGPYTPGFSFDALSGHALILARETHPIVEIAERLELRLVGNSALAFLVAARFSDRRGESNGRPAAPSSGATRPRS
jgi:hypothetical protein